MNKRRLFASAMAACMLLSTMPSTALATGTEPNSAVTAVSDDVATAPEAPAAVTEVATLAELKNAIDQKAANIKVNGTITIDENLSIAPQSPVTITTSAEDALTVTGTLTLGKNVTVVASDAMLYANGGTINIEGATLECDHTSRALGFAANGGKINMTSGSVSSYWTGLTASGQGSQINVSGGSVSASDSNAIIAKNYGTATISDAEVVSSSKNFATLWVKENGNLTVEGGTISSETGAVISNEGGTATVTGGQFIGYMATKNGATLTISGGTFSDDSVFAYLADGANIELDDNIKIDNGVTIEGKSVTISDADNDATITTDVTDVFTVGANGTLTLGENITVQASDSILYANGGTINIDGATLKSTSTENALGFAANGGKINMVDGSVSAYWTGLTASGTNSQVNVSGGTVESTNSNAILAKNSGTATISAGTVKSGGEFVPLWVKQNGNLKVEGGTISSETGAVISNEGGIATVTDGKFTGYMATKNDATLTISGGYFVVDPTAYLANGYVVVESDLTGYNHKVVDEVSTYTVSFQIGDATYSVRADTTTFDGATTELNDALTAYAGSNLTFKGWKLSGTDNFATGAIPAPTAPNTTYVAVFEKKADSSDVAVTPAPSVGDTYVIVPDTIPTEYKTVVENAVKNVGVTELNNLAGDMANNITGDEKNQAKTALAGKGITLGDDDSVTIHVQTYLNVKATDYKQSENGSVTLTLDITPMFQMIASTADNKADIDLEGADQNSVVMDSGALKITKPVTVTIPLPANSVDNGTDVFVKHIAQENKVYIYTATVTDGKITFTNPHGFSEFTITSENPAAASVGETFYATLQDAVDAALSTPTAITTITVLKSDQTVTVNTPGSFIVNGTATATINCGSNITMTKTPVDGGVKYTFTTSTPSNPSYPSGGSDYTPSNPTYNVSVPTKVENGSVSVSTKNPTKGSTVTLTVTPDKGYELDTLTVTDKNGNKIALTDLGNGKYSFTMPASKVNVKATFVETPVEPEAPVNPFYDVAETDYFFDAVLWANENGITSGVGNGQFAPNATCTRAQMVTFLWNAAGCPNVSEDYADFTDVTANDYYYKAVLWAKANNITSGTAEGVFSPDLICDRAQMATFLYKFAEGKAVGTSNRFADVTASDYYAQPVQWAVENGITSGTGDTTFGPNDPCTRAQMVTFLYRLLAE